MGIKGLKYVINMSEITLNEKEIKIQALRTQAQDIINYGKNITAYCAYIPCFECPMNVGEKEIICISNMVLKR